MGAAVFTDLTVVLVAVVLVIFAIPWLAITDVASRSKESFVSTGHPKHWWLMMLIGFTVVTGFIGLGLSIHYLVRVRPTLRDLGDDSLSLPLWQRIGVALLLIVAMVSAQYGVGLLHSAPNLNPNGQAAIEGHLQGKCGTSTTSSEGGRVSVVLSNLRSGTVSGVTTIGGRTSRTNFVFDVTPGTYRVTATSGTVLRHWGLTYGGGSPPVSLAIPVAMNVSIPVVC